MSIVLPTRTPPRPVPGRWLWILGSFAVLAVLFERMGVGRGWIAWATGSDVEGGVGPWIGAAVIAALVVLNVLVINRLGRSAQVVVIWSELIVLLLAFFYSFDLSFAFIARKIGFLITQGVTTTLYISAISIVIASAIALVGAIAKLSPNGIAFGLASFYTSLFRGLPLLMQIYIIYLGLPQLGYVVGPVPAGIAALSLCYGAYMTEIFRAGIESIPRGQWEASEALGLKRTQIMRKIILPQAMRIIVPPTGNQFIAMLKDSSLVSVMGIWEIMYLARTQGQTEFRHIEMLITASMIYWLLSMVLEYGQARLERHFSRSLRR
ncbi:amino acid ABC transporter permease [Aureimonas phyllosphaerae]|uniref:Glutamate/aspartate import permease protein GltK n=1 Tax=Aureimonas phyllosphaerae TaxID=1166078 RepID=A0A7W6C4G1_9HYPH|nr:amino acid ABC transporter permease [Aureimonas phyllosphaerae]MBB3938262.1 polar amino acid transport system permease protein [Aureimonas phyllosphaerae]MBB3962269.1 polar amino acid transport system permease protein [Aureimonas phyllosphaerae]SFF59047.1 amino acid ABC transporter membrane protein, PAAT family [Aureimonas phyllosphaerae]